MKIGKMRSCVKNVAKTKRKIKSSMFGHKNEPAGKHAANTHEAAASQNDKAESSTAQGNGVQVPQVQEGNLASQINPSSTANFAADEVVDGAQKAQRRKKTLKVFGVVLGILAVVYLGGVFLFMDRFMPNTYVGSHDFSLKTTAETQEAFSNAVKDYHLYIHSEGFQLSFSSDEATLEADPEAFTDAVHQAENAWAWPALIWMPHDVSDLVAATYSGTGLDDTIREAVSDFNKDAIESKNASLTYNKTTDSFEIEREVYGTELDADAVVNRVHEAMARLETDVALGDAEKTKPTLLSDDPRLPDAVTEANKMLSSVLHLYLGKKEIATIDKEELIDWIDVNDNAEACIPTDAIDDWASDISKKYSTLGTTRSYKRPDGKTFKVSGGDYGWRIKTDELISTVQKSVKDCKEENVDIPCSSEAYTYQEGGRDWGTRYIDVDLSAQHVYFYDENGKKIWDSACVSGLPTAKRATPKGVYSVNDKASPSTLTGYENGKKTYETKVTYWMPFEGNAVGFHDATWQPSFGGSRYKVGGSHGCINLPYSKAQSLYSLIKVGDVVVVHS